MKTYFRLLTFFIIVLPLTTLGQADTSKKYKYEICFQIQIKEKSILLKDKVIGITDTILSMVSGRVIDYKNQPIEYASICFVRLKDGIKTVVLTDSAGTFKTFIQPDKYFLSVFYLGHKTFKTETLNFTSGQIRQLNFKLIGSGGFHTYLISSKKQLTHKQLLRMERQLMRRK